MFCKLVFYEEEIFQFLILSWADGVISVRSIVEIRRAPSEKNFNLVYEMKERRA